MEAPLVTQLWLLLLIYIFPPSVHSTMLAVGGGARIRNIIPHPRRPTRLLLPNYLSKQQRLLSHFPTQQLLLDSIHSINCKLQ